MSRRDDVVTRDTVLTAAEVAALLKCSVKTVRRKGLPVIELGYRTQRYVWGDVLDYLKRGPA